MSVLDVHRAIARHQLSCVAVQAGQMGSVTRAWFNPYGTDKAAVAGPNRSAMIADGHFWTVYTPRSYRSGVAVAWDDAVAQVASACADLVAREPAPRAAP